MENKTTTELLDLLTKLTDEDYKENGKFEKVMKVLEDREPFFQIMSEDSDTGLPSVWEEIKDLKVGIKELKRHKHDEKTGDVLIRI